MKIIKPSPGQDIGDVCTKAYHLMAKSKEPLIMHFNEMTIIFMKDVKGLNHEHSLDCVKTEFLRDLEV